MYRLIASRLSIQSDNPPFPTRVAVTGGPKLGAESYQNSFVFRWKFYGVKPSPAIKPLGELPRARLRLNLLTGEMPIEPNAEVACTLRNLGSLTHVQNQGDRRAKSRALPRRDYSPELATVRVNI